MSRIVLLNGASSAGKTTLARAIQDAMPEPFLRMSLDLFLFGGSVLPARRDTDGPFSRAAIRARLFAGYHACLGAMLEAGVDLVVDHVIETPADFGALVRVLAPHDVFLVGVHCPVEVLEERERTRGDRPVGDARGDLAVVHGFASYDAEVDSREPARSNAAAVIAAWTRRAGTRGLGRLTRP